MTQNEKDLLLKDLCGRLLYGVVVGTTDNDGSIPNFWSLDAYNRLTDDVKLTNCEVDADRLTDFCDVRPYLFPLSSMTEWQDRELEILMKNSIESCGMLSPYDCLEMERFFNENHLDWRGLIPMGLAIDATGLNVY